MSRRIRRKKSGLSLGILLLFAAVFLIAVGGWKFINEQKDVHVDNAIEADSAKIAVSLHNLIQVETNDSLKEQIVRYEGMDISFNAAMHVPNWVAWELTGVETEGTYPRENKFYCDESVVGCPEHYDYNYSGYDRGHMAPAGDMKWSKIAMHQTFSLVNICPQLKSLNTGVWKRLEEKCRQWAKADSAIVIVCGPVLTDKITEYIGDTRVVVPKRFFKVILSPFANPMRGIGFIMPNGKVRGGMQTAAVSIDEVERVTGHDFFSTLPDEIEDEVECQCDFHYWSTIK